MKKSALFLVILSLGVVSVWAQKKKIKAYSGGNVIYQTNLKNVDSITFPNSMILFNTDLWQHNLADVDSLLFSTPNSGAQDTTAIDTSSAINIVYNGTSASITNPYSSRGVSITTSGANVTVNSTISTDNIVYNIWGTTTSGSLAITTSKNIILRLRGASITNPNGPAVKINSDRKATVHLLAGTANMLKDGTASSGKGALQSAGEFVFQGTGTLNILGMAKHGIQSSGATQVLNGNINILSAVKDGFNVDNFIMDSGSVTVSGTTGDAIDGDQGFVEINGGTIRIICNSADTKGISCDSILTINGGDIEISMSGNESKGIKTDQDLTINGGNITITASGATVINGSDTSHCVGIKANGITTINDGDITITCTSTNNGGRCISADGELYINGGLMTLTTQGDGQGSTSRGFSPACIKVDSNLFVIGGEINCTSSGRGGRGIKVDGNITIGTMGANDSLISITVKTSGSNVVSSGGSSFGSSNSYKGAPKGIKAEGNISINSGLVRVYCSQNTSATAEGIESKDSIRINGGAVEVNTYDDGINATNWLCISGGKVWVNSRNNDALDCNGTNLTFSGGLIICFGSEQAVDVDLGERQGRSLTISGATVLARGGNMGVFSMNNSASPTMLNGQKYLRTSYSYGSTLVIKNNNQQTVCVFKHPTLSGSGFDAGTSDSGAKPPGGNSTSFIFTSPSVTSGNYTVFSSATITGGSSWHGYYTGATVTTSGNGTSISAQQ